MSEKQKSKNLPALPSSEAFILQQVSRGIAPAIIQAEGSGTRERFFEYFFATIDNDHTRHAYMRAVYRFMAWADHRGLTLGTLRPLVIAAYIQGLKKDLSIPSVKQHLAAIRGLFDYLVTGQIVPFNPAAAVRGPKHVVSEGKTPILEPYELRQLFSSIETTTILGLRDRALIGVLLFSFARISAAVGMKVKDYQVRGQSSYFHFKEKGGKWKRIPVHHQAAQYLDAYLNAAGIRDDSEGWLFRATKGGRNPNTLTERQFIRQRAYDMIRRRALQAGLGPGICNHSFRGSGITVYLDNGGSLDTAADIAGHASTKTTRLYDRTDRHIKRGEIERVHI